MFDRLGRKDDETPFIVEWFVRNGIEVWSATEGQQRFDTHVDKLLNYIRYWQASGESIKTSVRTKTRMEQLTESGYYTGGSVAYGYRLDKRGRTNKKNKEVCDLAIDEDAAKIIQLIFHKYVYEGFGAQRLSRYLTEMNILKPNGKNFPNTSINRIIKNPIYTGVIRNGEAQSEIIPELQIIDPETFARAQKIMSDRTTHHAETPLNLKGQSLLVGNIFCGHCRNRLTLTTGGRNRLRKDGSIYHDVRARYQCHYTSNFHFKRTLQITIPQSCYGGNTLQKCCHTSRKKRFSLIGSATGESVCFPMKWSADRLNSKNCSGGFDIAGLIYTYSCGKIKSKCVLEGSNNEKAFSGIPRPGYTTRNLRSYAKGFSRAKGKWTAPAWQRYI